MLENQVIVQTIEFDRQNMSPFWSETQWHKWFSLSLYRGEVQVQESDLTGPIKIYWQDEQNELLLLYFSENCIHAFALWKIEFEFEDKHHFAHLLKFALAPGQRGQKSPFSLSEVFWGQQSQCLGRVTKNRPRAWSYFLEVEQSNLRAIGFYRKVGFEEIPGGLTKHFYGQDRHAVKMIQRQDSL